MTECSGGFGYNEFGNKRWPDVHFSVATGLMFLFHVGLDQMCDATHMMTDICFFVFGLM